MSGYSLLTGVRVLEVAQLAPSSVGGHLADLGADVIKIESGPVGDPVRVTGARAVGAADGPGFMHLRWNRGKRSVELDLRSPHGKAEFRALIGTADVLIEGTRAGYFERLGLGFEELRKINPKLVFCSVSGVGEDGPYRSLASGGMWFDTYAGLRTVCTGQPSPPGVMSGSGEPTIAMYALGAYGAMGILAALVRARATGAGVRVSVASSDIATSWIPDKTDAALNADSTLARGGWLPDGRLPEWPRVDSYATKDGGTIVFGSYSDKFFTNFCGAVDRPDLAEIDLRTVDDDHERRARYVWSELDAIFRSRTKAEWVALFLEHDIAGGPVNTVEELIRDPHFTARRTTYDTDLPHGGTVTLTASPIRVDGEQFSPALAPDLGAHTEDVLSGPTDSPAERQTGSTR